jgi:hypothetical protein
MHWIKAITLAAALVAANLSTVYAGPVHPGRDTPAGMRAVNEGGPVSMLLSRPDGGRLTFAGSEADVCVPVASCCAAWTASCRSVGGTTVHLASAPSTLVSLGCLLAI